MELIVHKDFDELFEANELTYLALYPNQIQKLFYDEEGIHAFSSFRGLQKIHGKYIGVFVENFVFSADDFFFFEENSPGLSHRLTILLTRNKNWLHNIERVNNDELRREILATPGNEPVQSLAEVVAQLEKDFEEGSEIFADHSFLKLILVYQNPKKYLRMFIKILNNSLPAYRKARLAVETDIAKRLADFKAPPKEYYEKFPSPTDFGLADRTNEIHPSLIYPFAILLSPGCPLISGLYLNEKIERQERRNKPKDVLVGMFKMVADRNKLDILTMLKEETMYNLQIANALGISPAAANHHMVVLIDQGFVSMERRDGKTYYILEQKQIEETIANLGALFL